METIKLLAFALGVIFTSSVYSKAQDIIVTQEDYILKKDNSYEQLPKEYPIECIVTKSTKVYVKFECIKYRNNRKY